MSNLIKGSVAMLVLMLVVFQPKHSYAWEGHRGGNGGHRAQGSYAPHKHHHYKEHHNYRRAYYRPYYRPYRNYIIVQQRPLVWVESHWDRSYGSQIWIQGYWK